ncbi:MAG: ubiquinol-cytochrome c reductase iron-sulfur subunit [Deltaproteobacteria bacterium]|nr:ubiquinol-cytochrome c reductase iron-sulfur subunit [Deltaproteobacteria bacterium]
MQTNIPGSEKLVEKPVERNLWTRRDFFGFAGWGAFLSAIGLGLLGFLRLLYPRVLFEPSPVFKAGKIEDFVEGEVSEKFKEEQRVWIIREAGKIYAIQAICTHLGCTPRWLPLEGKFKCPCHGSGFTKDGVNFEGPAPRPLERLAIRMDEEGNLIIDKSKKYLYEKGQWEDPESFIVL